ncbi:MAG: nucleoside hydrolase [Planctomycetota bacterium]|nr:nucleoside hydrolase [Planctomycetota bacterium]
MSSTRLPLILAAVLALSLCVTAAGAEAKRVPVVYSTDLYHPHVDADDHVDLATVFALPELDVRAVLLDNGQWQRQKSGRTPVEQMLAMTGRRVQYAPGLAPLKSPEDDGRTHPAEYQQAVELLLKALRESGEPVHVITTGSVRDVAAAFNREPELLRAKVAGLYINIGNSSLGGDEYNVELDRAAYRRLLQTGLAIYWYPCFPKNVQESTYWLMADFPATLKASPAPLRNYFIYAVRHLDPTKYDPVTALAADLGPVDEAFAKAGAFRPAKEMWCTPALLTVAGRRIYRVAGGYVAAAAPPPGAEEVRLYEYVPTRLEVDPQGKPTRIDYNASDPNVKVIRVSDPKLYGEAMNGCLRDLFTHFPAKDTRSPAAPR